MAHPQPAPDPARARAKQLFAFLKAFAEKNLPLKRRLSEQEWSLRLSELPSHESIGVGVVTDDESSSGSEALLRVRRPSLRQAPQPAALLRDWLEEDWKDPDKGIRVRSSRTVLRPDGEPAVLEFAADVSRTEGLRRWQAEWNAWAETERPARAAMRVFEQLYALHGRFEREAEGIELMLGDGRLRWQRDDGPIDHPVLLQRVEMRFDPAVPEFLIEDADRGPELYSALMDHGGALSSESFSTLRAELESGAYHPLAVDGTQAFLKGLAQRLDARGEYCSELTNRPPTDSPRVEHDVVLFLRKRASGFAAAFERVLKDLDGTRELPASLTRLVGIETAPAPEGIVSEPSPWGEPLDLLLSKPANPEQVAVARSLERHKAVLVQGPPGTGKTHTIANLIGHLVAHGKRVLVTSHTTKALSVLRDKIVKPLQPLCVSVLASDAEARQQMEEAVKGIISRLNSATEDDLEADVASMAEQRAAINAELTQITKDLVTVREAEYKPICVSGEQLDPSDATRWVVANQSVFGWIPGTVQPGAPMPLSAGELIELYQSNLQISPEEESELQAGYPDPDGLLTPEEFAIDVEALGVVQRQAEADPWRRPAAEAEIAAVTTLLDQTARWGRELSHLAPWQRRVVADGYAAGANADGWKALSQLVDTACETLEAAQRALLESAPEPPGGRSPEDLRKLCEQLLGHVEAGRSLSALRLTFHSEWKWFIANASVNGSRPRTNRDFKALRTALVLAESRNRLSIAWGRLAAPAGLPGFDSLGTNPEPVAAGYADQFESLLGWWSARWQAPLAAAEACGFSWDEFRAREIATRRPSLPFDLDCLLLGEALPREAAFHLRLCQRARAMRRLAELEIVLDEGPASRATLAAVQARDPSMYAVRLDVLRDLIAKAPVQVHREGLLRRLGAAAPAWARTVADRVKPHDSAEPPRDCESAWRWTQLSHEITRRSNLDEEVLTRRLEQRQRVLRDVTTQLIDRRAWLGQLRRTNLRTQQALNGWLNTQRRIGKGTGKRAPKLRALARAQLAEAREAVPVWIMPLSRVAESFDPATTRFDVVILDEASQSDATGLLAWYLGNQVAVVGDNEQVSPLDIGRRIEDIEGLISQYLADIPSAGLYDGKMSVYDLAGQCFGGTIRLREHFRCVPEIIEFSNGLSYNGEIRPLRDGATARHPHVAEITALSIPGVGRSGKENMAEAQLLTALLAAMLERPEYERKSFGAITLLGDDQAIAIQTLASRVIGAAALASRHFVAGNAAQFQGDERDIMLLSMVDSSSPDGPLHLSQLPATKQRYNVAASRARDQMWLIHSLDPNRDLKPGDLRRRLIEHVREPMSRVREIERVQARAESPFESAVIERLVTRGYRVEPQVWIGGYRIDLVVGEPGNQVAVECDGDRFHGVDQIPQDMMRQATLERCGWRFVRIRGTRFYRDPGGTTDHVCEQLARMGIEPAGQVSDAAPARDCELKRAIVRRAWEIMREQEWLPGTSMP